MRILLVEDDAVLRDVMLRSLADAGHRVDVSTNVEDADHLWRVQPFDAVLLDLNLPATASATSGLASGLTALRQARARGDRTPVLVLTARGRTEVLMLEARVLEARNSGRETVISVLFDAMLRENGADAPAEQVREVWHIRRDEGDPAAQWTLEGIQQLAQ